MEWELHIFDNNRLCCLFLLRRVLCIFVSVRETFKVVHSIYLHSDNVTASLKGNPNKMLCFEPHATALFIVDLMSVNDSSHPR